MLEIFIIYQLVRSLKRKAEAKGYSGAYAALGAVGWIGGEVIGFVVGELLGLGLGVYLLAIGGASIGAAVAYFFISRLPSRLTEDEDLKEIFE